MTMPLASTSDFSPLAVSPITLSDRYYLYDQFTTAISAGSVNGTLAEPLGGARTVTDTNSKISTTGGAVSFATGSAVYDLVAYSLQTRVSGKTILSKITHANNSGQGVIAGSVANTAGEPNYGIRFRPSGVIACIRATGILVVGAYTAATEYQVALVFRAAGFHLFVKGGTEYTNWTLLYSSVTGSQDIYPVIQVLNPLSVFTATKPRVPKQLYVPVPLQSDSMTATTTNGLGNQEGNGPAGNSYSGVGTPQVAAGVRSFSALSGGGLGVSVLACSTSNVNIEVNVTRTAGSAGIIARRVDANNYIQCLHNGTNVIVSQVVAGVSTTLSTTAVTYSAGANMKFHATGTAYRAFYNNTAAGTGTVPTSTNGNHGIITNNLSGSFDNLVIWPTGTEAQYEDISNL